MRHHHWQRVRTDAQRLVDEIAWKGEAAEVLKGEIQKLDYIPCTRLVVISPVAYDICPP
ncbi:hypothetical protein ACFXPY_12985 [Streptomyces sp. NPDC059153]|uniref:hypothetical protein n=1 Tax=Streptomyces sp. NPDC059153 TaxID=3346743 RepID=UPI0036A5B5EC